MAKQMCNERLQREMMTDCLKVRKEGMEGGDLGEDGSDLSAW